MTYIRNDVRDYCESNPGATLTVEEIQNRFGATERAAKGIMVALRAEGLLSQKPVYVVTKPKKWAEKEQVA